MTEPHEDKSMMGIPAGLGAIEDEDEDMGDGEPLDLRKENNAKIIMVRPTHTQMKLKMGG